MNLNDISVKNKKKVDSPTPHLRLRQVGGGMILEQKYHLYTVLEGDFGQMLEDGGQHVWRPIEKVNEDGTPISFSPTEG